MKNKYASHLSRHNRVKDYMQKVELWLPIPAFNRLKTMALQCDRPIQQLAATSLYRSIEENNMFGFAFTPQIMVKNSTAEETLSKFIIATARTGITIDDLFMIGLDSGLSYQDIQEGINGLVNGYLVKYDNGVFKYAYYGALKKSVTLSKFKGKPIATRENKKPKSLARKLIKGE